MTKTEQMRRVIFGLKITIAVVITIFVMVTLARCADSAQTVNAYSLSVVEGLFSLVILLLSLYLNTLRNRISKLEEADVVSSEICALKRDKDDQVVKTLTESMTKTEVHVEQIFELCNSIKVTLANIQKDK